jgi:predicted peroxiredoxin
MIAHGPDHSEHVTIPFVMAVAALASDVEAGIGLQVDGVEIAIKGRADTIPGEGSPPLAKLIYLDGRMNAWQASGRTLVNKNRQVER